MKNYKDIDEYIADQPDDKKAGLQQFRQIIKSVAPQAEEVISYGMPAYKYYKILVYFAVFKDHYGFYPTSKPVDVFKDKLKPYKTSKGAIHFPFNKPLPERLIVEIVKYRVKEDFDNKQLKKLTKKSKKKNCLI